MSDTERERREAMKRADLARALGLAEAIAKARPYPPNMDGVRDIASEIAALITAALTDKEAANGD